MAQQITDTNFNESVLQSDKLTVVDFWAQWCGPCRALGPIIEEISKEYEGKANIFKLDVDANPETSTQFQITSIPTILFFKNGEIVDRVVGAQTKATLINKINAHL